MSKMLFHLALESYILYALQVLVIFKDFYLKLLVLRASVCVVVLIYYMLWILFLLGLYCTLFPPQVHEPLNSYSSIMLAVPRNTGDNFNQSHTSWKIQCLSF